MIRLAARNGMLWIELDDSLWQGLSEATGIARNKTLGTTSRTGLLQWADNSQNPGGQKASLARAIAALIHVAGELEVRRMPATPPPDFWEAVSR